MAKNSTKDNFEDVYLRSSYLKKIDINAPSQYLSLYSTFSESVTKIGGRFYRKNCWLFNSAGFGAEDITGFCDVQAWSYISLFSLTTSEKELAKFVAKRSKDYPERPYPTALEIFKKDRSNFMSFLNQRLVDLVRVCKQKNRNIRGTKEVKGFYLKTENSQPVSQELIAEDPELYGYKKVSDKKISMIKKAMNGAFYYRDFVFKGKEYIFVDFTPTISREDALDTICNPHNNMFYMRPDEILEYEEDILNDIKAKMKIKEYHQVLKHKKIKILKARKKELTQNDNHIKILIDKKIMELSSADKRSNP